MLSKVKPGQRSACQEACENLSMEGLRTVVITQKLLSSQKYEELKTKLHRINTRVDIDRAQAIQDVLHSYETEMEYLGVSGVEDQLQFEVLQTFETLRQAGIQIWMLTGDKIETAKCVAISTGLKSRQESVFEIRDLTNKNEILVAIERFTLVLQSAMLVIDGDTLSIVTNDEHLKQRFFTSALKAKAVCICRCSPTQKA